MSKFWKYFVLVSLLCAMFFLTFKMYQVNDIREVALLSFVDGLLTAVIAYTSIIDILLSDDR